MHYPMHKVPIGILGASGYTGRELCALVPAPGNDARLRGGTTRRGERADVPAQTITFAATEDAPLSDAALVFSALPHGESAPWVAAVHEAGAKVVDLSADLRPGASHDRRSRRPTASPRSPATRSRGADVVANPGCYATVGRSSRSRRSRRAG